MQKQLYKPFASTPSPAPLFASNATAEATSPGPLVGELHERIAVAAFLKAAARDFEPGHELDDWLEAEHDVATEDLTEEMAAAAAHS